jgi:hypothetical protein
VVRRFVLLALALALVLVAAGRLARAAGPGRIAVERGGQVYTLAFDGSDPQPVGSGTEPVWSVDGKLAYVRSGSIIVDGRAVARGAHPAFSPDGSRLAWIGSGEVWAAAPDGTAAHALTAGAGPKTAAAWSPDGSRLAYLGLGGLAVIPAAGGAPRVLAPAQGVVPPAWFPDGTRLAYADDGLLYAVAADGGGRVELLGARWETRVTAPPRISPDGRTVVFSTRRGVYAVRADGADLRRLTLLPGAEPVFAPGAATIVFSRGGGLWQMNASGTCERPFAPYARPAWQPGAAAAGGGLECSDLQLSGRTLRSPRPAFELTVRNDGTRAVGPVLLAIHSSSGRARVGSAFAHRLARGDSVRVVAVVSGARRGGLTLSARVSAPQPDATPRDDAVRLLR